MFPRCFAVDLNGLTGFMAARMYPQTSEAFARASQIQVLGKSYFRAAPPVGTGEEQLLNSSAHAGLDDKIEPPSRGSKFRLMIK
jgi:hypothetical protein